MKRFLIFALVSLFLTFPSLSPVEAQTNTVTLTSYYPAPFGAYDRLRLVPRSGVPPCTAAQEGTLYIPSTTNVVNQCTNSAWVPIAGGLWDTSDAGTGTATLFDNAPPSINVDRYFPVKPYPDLSVEQPYLGIGTNLARRPLHVKIDNPNLETILALENDFTSAAAYNSGAAISFRGRTGGGLAFVELAAIKADYKFSPPTTYDSNLNFDLRYGIGAFNTRVLSLRGAQNGIIGIRSINPNAILSISTDLSTSTRAFAISTSQATPTADLLSVLVGGNVGIGAPTPTEKLEVVGNIKATTLILTSDAGLKKDITPVTGALEKISRLKGVSFEWKDNPADQRKHLGVLAQDVEKIFPESVYGIDGAKGVDYPSLIAPLIEAVKELKGQNEILTEQILSQQQQIQSLQKSLGSNEPLLTPTP